VSSPRLPTVKRISSEGAFETEKGCGLHHCFFVRIRSRKNCPASAPSRAIRLPEIEIDVVLFASFLTEPTFSEEANERTIGCRILNQTRFAPTNT